ncbi:MAG: hypothetical protein K2N67_07070, partial [Mucispirillum sp.]|nr:hypothetical protein [Mucispirillum sp.]
MKVSEAAKKAGISVEDALKALHSAGLNAASGSDTVTEEDLAASGIAADKRAQLDSRRREVFQKAQERHRKGVKFKEVFVNKDGRSLDVPQRKPVLSKEELMKRRKDLEHSLKKVDEDRIQYNKERAEQASAQNKPKEEKQARPDTVTANQAAVKNETAEKEPAKNADTAQPIQKQPLNKTSDRPSSQHGKRDDGKFDRPFNRDRDRDNRDKSRQEDNRQNRPFNRDR